MPIVEYYSPDTHTVYQFYARTLADAGRVPRCPAGGKLRMERMFSPFAVIGRAKEPSAVPADESFSPEQEAAMMRLSSQLEGMNEENPDPRQLGRMMREMSQLMGKGKNPGQMDEVIRRLEAGESLDRLEDQLESVMGDEEGDFEGGNEKSAATKLRRLLGPARKDPTLYELREYLGKAESGK